MSETTNIANVDSAHAVTLFVNVQIFSIFFLQKLAIHVGPGEVQLVLPIFYVGLLILAGYTRIYLDIPRFVAFSAFAVAAAGGHAFLASNFSLPSLLLVLSIFFVGCFYCRVSWREYLACLRFFNTCTAVLGLITIYQVAIQYTLGNQYWLNLDLTIPESLQFTGYNYLQPVHWNSPYLKPNAIFALEVSMIAQACALAIVIEILQFRRPLYIALFSMVMLLTLAGSGLLIILFCLPVLLLRLSPRILGVCAVMLVAGGITAIAIDWSAQIAARISEFSTPGTSGYYRFTVPLLLFAEQVVNPDFLFSGNGAGTTIKGTAYLLLPFSKLLSEYGLLTLVCFYIFISIVLFAHTPMMAVSYALFVYYNLAGSTLGMPMCGLQLLVLAAFFRIDGAPRRLHQRTPSRIQAALSDSNS